MGNVNIEDIKTVSSDEPSQLDISISNIIYEMEDRKAIEFKINIVDGKYVMSFLVPNESTDGL